MPKNDEMSLGQSFVLLLLAGVTGLCYKTCENAGWKTTSAAESTYVQYIQNKNGTDSVQNHYKVKSPCNVVVDQFKYQQALPEIFSLNFCDNVATLAKIKARQGYRVTYYDTTRSEFPFEDVPIGVKKTADSLLHQKL